MKGVIWLTGLSGAGKTTVAGMLQANLTAKGVRPVLLDGNRLRHVYPIEFGYSADERRSLAASYGRLAQEISSQGHLVICSTISLFRDIHRWNRHNLPGYLEVWLRVPLEELRRRDIKGIYEMKQDEDKGPVAGVDFPAEFPEAPDLIIDNFGAITPQGATACIMSLIEQAY